MDALNGSAGKGMQFTEPLWLLTFAAVFGCGLLLGYFLRAMVSRRRRRRARLSGWREGEAAFRLERPRHSVAATEQAPRPAGSDAPPIQPSTPEPRDRHSAPARSSSLPENSPPGLISDIASRRAGLH